MTENQYDKDYYYGDGKKGQYRTLAEPGGYNADMVQKAMGIKNIIKPRSYLELGCGTGQIIDMLRIAGIDARGIDLSEFAAGQSEYITQGDVTKVDFPDADMVASFDMLEHLTEKDIDKVLHKCEKFPIIFHSISIAYNEYGDVTQLKDMDKTHISMHSPSWWMGKFHTRFADSHYMNVMSRKDYIEYKKEGYKFTNLNFLLTREKISDLQII